MVLNQLHEAHDAAHDHADEPDDNAPDNDNDEGADDYGDYGDGRIAISEWRGLFTDDVGWRMLLLHSMTLCCVLVVTFNLSLVQSGGDRADRDLREWPGLLQDHLPCDADSGGLFLALSFLPSPSAHP